MRFFWDMMGIPAYKTWTSIGIHCSRTWLYATTSSTFYVSGIVVACAARSLRWTLSGRNSGGRRCG